MTGDLYVQSVIDHIPEGLSLRDQIAMELRAHIAERTTLGQPLDQILGQLGDPQRLAASYLASVLLTPAPIFARLVAKVIDAAIVCLISGGIAIMLYLAWRAKFLGDVFFWLPAFCILASILGFVAYTVYAEYRFGRTLGKKLMGIRVVRENGTRISLGQALLRQLPFFGQFFFIDALFVPFTEKRQRAFELITKTRAVAAVLGLVLLA